MSEHPSPVQHWVLAVATIAVAVAVVRVGVAIHHAPAPAPTTRVLGALALPAPVPAAWSNPAWYIDPADATGCASDGNTCAVATCGDAGNIGPCLSWRGVEARLGCTGSPAGCPRWRQSTTITFLSSDVSSDTMILRPSVENGAQILVVGQPTVVCTGTLSGIVTKNQSVGQLLEATLCGAAAQDEFVEDTTRGSGAWTYALASGTTWKMSQPIPLMTTWSCFDPTEDNGWAVNDAYQVVTFPSIYLQEFEPSIGDVAGTGCGFATVSDVTLAQPASVISSTRMGPSTALIQTRVMREVVGFDQVDIGSGSPVSINVDALNIQSPASVTPYSTAQFKSGIIHQTFEASVGETVEFGVVVSGTGMFLSGQMNDVFIDTASQISVQLGAISNGVLPVWGPGTLNVLAPGQLSLASSAVTGLLVSHLLLNGKPVACAATNTADAGLTCGRALSAATIDLPVIDGGFGGAAFDPAGASITTPSSPF